ncbi:ThiF family adenylyltransferase [Luteibacter sp. 9135]|uniref:ThiF family adenylyltransferase n=1 Tax=Luteibacter sp. 9135 TaxID=1500893 RepID=UPI00068B2F2D|nr:ThiF family adenylyltransferase [Luteibacter sp. 9135]
MPVAPQIEVSRELVKHGFRPISFRKGVLRMRGALVCAFGEVPIDIAVADWDFVVYPSIWLRERPERLKGVQPHIFARGGLCYLAPGVLVLDRHNPVQAVLQCLAQATSVLDDLALNMDYRREEFTREFLAEWALGQSPLPRTVLKAGVGAGAREVSWGILNDRQIIVGSDPTELRKIADAMGVPLLQTEKQKGWVFRTTKWPVLSEKFPTNAREALKWIETWDRKLFQAIVKRLKDDRDYLRWGSVRWLIQGPFGWFAMDVGLGDESVRSRYKRDRRAFVQRIYHLAEHLPLSRVSVLDWSGDFIHSRNLSYSDLSGRKVTLIGCGAIGSHLSEGLVRLGAGHGKGARLRIVDPDTLQAENLGRHALGYPALTQPKAQAMASELRRTFPLANVTFENNSALVHPDLFDADLVIDATGEEALSEAINARHQALASGPPMLYARIFRNGEAVQTLWVDGPGEGACFRCLRGVDPNRPRVERFPLSNTPPPPQQWRGCSAVTPYAVSSPMLAAGLALDAIGGWLDDKAVSPRFRTLIRPGSNVQKVKDQNVSKLPGCPVCAQRQAASRAA